MAAEIPTVTFFSLPCEIIRHIFKFYLQFDDKVSASLALRDTIYLEIIAPYLEEALESFDIFSKLDIQLGKSLHEEGWTVSCKDFDLINSLWNKYRPQLWRDKILVATGLPHTSMVEIINFSSPKSSWNFAAKQKESLERSGCVGAVLQNQARIYGGYQKFQLEENPVEITYDDGFIIGQPDTKVEKMVDQRKYAAGMILDTALWISGGTSDKTEHSSTEFINHPLIKGFDLNTPKAFKPDPDVQNWFGPIINEQWVFGIEKHCMVQYDESSIYMIGGCEGGSEDGPTDATWIFNPLKNFMKKLTYNLKTHRSGHCCGKMYSRDKSKILLVVAGGEVMEFPQAQRRILNSVEILDPTSGKGWEAGPKLPFVLNAATMVTSPDGCGVIIMGGNQAIIEYEEVSADEHYRTVDDDEYEEEFYHYFDFPSDKMLELRSDSNEWVILDQCLKQPRMEHVSFPITDEVENSLQKFVNGSC